MFKHVVMFKFRDDVPEEIRKASREEFKQGIEALTTVIPSIRSIKVGFNINPAEKWDICLESTFDSIDEIKAYGVHPAHKEVAQKLIPYIGERACVDFQ